MGGSGSKFLRRSLSTKFEVGDKPDTVFRQLIGSTKLETEVKPQGSFFERSLGCSIDVSHGPEVALIKYLDFLKNKPNRVAVLNTFPELGLLSKLEVPNVVFLLRHPLHSYVSWSKPERHGDLSEQLGGLNSLANLQYHSNRWNKVTNEYFALKEKHLNPILLRYEYLHDDLPKNSELEDIFSAFDISKRNFNILSSEGEEYMRKVTKENYVRLYDEWFI